MINKNCSLFFIFICLLYLHEAQSESKLINIGLIEEFSLKAFENT
jgi:hypothetical protein